MAKAAFFLILALLPGHALAQRPQAELACRHAGTDFVYDCVIRLKRAGQPLAGADILVGADMPSMPMAHNVKPVKAKRGQAPGEYQARLDLEMQGEWAVKLRLSGPLRDQIVVNYVFDERGAQPVIRSGRSPRK